MGETEQEPTPVQPIDYRTAPPDSASRSRAVLIALLILGATLAGVILLFLTRMTATPRTVAVAIATPAPVLVAPVDQEQVRRKEAYAEYLAHAARPGHVVYDEDPLAAAKLVAAQPQQHRAIAYGGVEAPWANAFQRPVVEINPADVNRVEPFMDRHQPNRAVLFVGKLTSPAGNARLVFLDMDVALSGARLAGKRNDGSGDASAAAEYVVKIQRKLGYRIFDAAATDGYPNQFRQGPSLTITTPSDAIPIRWIDGSLRADQPAGSGVRFFAGMLDPQDPAHCTIDYDLAGQRGAIDVYLTDEDFLRVLPRTGVTTGGTWAIPAAPAATSTVEKPAAPPTP